MSGCDHGPTGTPELDAAVALRAMAEGDLSHAAHHVAAAVAADPGRDDLLELVDRLAEAAGGTEPAIELFPLERTWYGAAAVRARLMLEDTPDDALDLLCQIAVVRPDCPVLGWAVPHADRLDTEEAVGSLARLLGLELDPTSPEGEALWSPVMELLGALLAREPDVEPLATLAAMLTRRAGRLEEAYAMAVATWARFRSWRAAVAWANAARAVGRWDDAVRAWTEALSIEPDDLSVRLDWGDALLDRGELAAARERYAEVLAREADHAWAAPSALYVDWLRFPTASARLALTGWAAAHPDQPRAVELHETVTPWVGRLPDPFEEDEPSSEVVAVSSRVARVVAAVAVRPFHASGWTEAGAELARAEGVGTDDATDLWQVAVTPTVLPVDPRFDAWGWRTTHAAAFVLAALPGWDDTAHRMALLDLIEQPRVAPAVAAMAALAERGRGDPALRADVRDRLIAALDDPRPAVAWAAACAMHRMRLDTEPALARVVLYTLRAYEDPQPEA